MTVVDVLLFFLPPWRRAGHPMAPGDHARRQAPAQTPQKKGINRANPR